MEALLEGGQSPSGFKLPKEERVCCVSPCSQEAYRHPNPVDLWKLPLPYPPKEGRQGHRSGALVASSNEGLAPTGGSRVLVQHAADGASLLESRAPINVQPHIIHRSPTQFRVQNPHLSQHIRHLPWVAPTESHRQHIHQQSRVLTKRDFLAHTISYGSRQPLTPDFTLNSKEYSSRRFQFDDEEGVESEMDHFEGLVTGWEDNIYRRVCEMPRYQVEKLVFLLYRALQIHEQHAGATRRGAVQNDAMEIHIHALMGALEGNHKPPCRSASRPGSVSGVAKDDIMHQNRSFRERLYKLVSENEELKQKLLDMSSDLEFIRNEYAIADVRYTKNTGASKDGQIKCDVNGRYKHVCEKKSQGPSVSGNSPGNQKQKCVIMRYAKEECKNCHTNSLQQRLSKPNSDSKLLASRNTFHSDSSSNRNGRIPGKGRSESVFPGLINVCKPEASAASGDRAPLEASRSEISVISIASSRHVGKTYDPRPGVARDELRIDLTWLGNTGIDPSGLRQIDETSLSKEFISGKNGAPFNSTSSQDSTVPLVIKSLTDGSRADQDTGQSRDATSNGAVCGRVSKKGTEDESGKDESCSETCTAIKQNCRISEPNCTADDCRCNTEPLAAIQDCLQDKFTRTETSAGDRSENAVQSRSGEEGRSARKLVTYNDSPNNPSTEKKFGAGNPNRVKASQKKQCPRKKHTNGKQPPATNKHKKPSRIKGGHRQRNSDC